ncbi:MAG: N-acetylmuramoyl-L-alanine amidase family protein [Stellaceae bacterium]
MREFAVTRRAVLRLVAVAVAGMATAARAHPVRRRMRPPRPVIVLDPGHGGLDPGAIGPGGVYEKTITLATAWRLAWLLAASGRFRVVMTRSDDAYVPLSRRVAIARAVRADLFLSLHADALPETAMRGLSVFTLSSRASDREAAALAASENRDAVRGISPATPRLVRRVLYDLARRQTANASLAFTHDILAALGREVVLLDHPERSADFVVLTAPDIPSVLVELGVLSNPHEEHLLEQGAYQQKLARGLARAIEAYFAGIGRP